MKNGKICVRILYSIDNSPRKTQLEMFYHPWLLCMDCKVSAIFIQSTYSKFYLAIQERVSCIRRLISTRFVSHRMLLPLVEISRILLLIDHMLQLCVAKQKVLPCMHLSSRARCYPECFIDHLRPVKAKLRLSSTKLITAFLVSILNYRGFNQNPYRFVLYISYDFRAQLASPFFTLPKLPQLILHLPLCNESAYYSLTTDQQLPLNATCHRDPYFHYATINLINCNQIRWSENKA